VQQQLRREVKEDMIEQAQQNPVRLSDIVASPDALQYVFQVSDVTEATDTASDTTCDLTGGDMLSFSRVPTDEDVSAQMKVVTSRESSCKQNAVVEVSLSDLQDTLNAFAARLENNVTRVHQMVASVTNSQ
jgi:hypothetical protein